ncbi:DUF222 domain-containing protein [Pseudarthrobacter sp. LMD1-1-1.1]|uniref:DUF222 domain-containing protein n=1 Tax=Pseudarthrobacter sp. LMD1-1-1.1 TaxID=3135242 RepID=UPI003420DADC
MEAIGEHLGAAYGRKAYDAGSWLPRPAHLHAVPGEASQHRATGPGHPDLLAGLAVRIAAVAVAAPDVLASASYLEAAEFAARAEDLARSVEYLQLLGAGAVDRTRAQAITDAAATTRAARSAAVVETDATWPNPPAGPGHPVVSPADEGCRNTAEFLRLRLHIPIREARRRLTLAHQVLPATSLTGEPLPPARPHLAAAITPTTTGATETGTGITSPAGYGPAVSSHAAALITATLDRLQHHTTAETLDTIEHHLTTAATTTDPDFLTRVAQRWTDTIDADGSEPTEEALRHTQGAFIRKPRHGLHHLEIFATTDQYEHLLTVMNTATNPRTAGDKAAGCQPGGIDLDRRTRAQKQLDGLITAAKQPSPPTPCPQPAATDPTSSPLSTTKTSSPPTPPHPQAKTTAQKQ